FLGDQLVGIRNVDGYGDTGDLVSSRVDGAFPFTIAQGVALGQTLTANPNPVMTPPKGNHFGPIDLAPYVPPPVLANLTLAKREPANKPINQTKAVVGALAFGVSP